MTRWSVRTKNSACGSCAPAGSGSDHHERMALKLDPRWPLVWRTPQSVQLGVDPAKVIIDELTPGQEKMLAALTVGISHSGLGLLCDGRVAERDELLALLEPALLPAPTPTAPAVVALAGVGPLVDELSRLLASTGVRVLLAESASDFDESAPDVAILTGHFVLSPTVHALWLRRDVPHLPIVLSDTGVTVGPFIEPGDGPCLLCLELHRRDADPSWPALAAQLFGRRSVAESTVLAIEGAALAARVVMARIHDGERGADTSASVRIDGASGAHTTQLWLTHPDCGCRGISHLVAVGSATSRRIGSGSPGVAQSARLWH